MPHLEHVDLDYAALYLCRRMRMEEDQAQHFKMPDDGEWYLPADIVQYEDPLSWWFYGVVSRWMHANGWSKRTVTDAVDGILVEFWQRGNETMRKRPVEGYNEPLLGVAAAYLALLEEQADMVRRFQRT